MKSGTTPTHTFEIKDVPVANISDLVVTYAQYGKKILEKTLDDVAIEGTSVKVTLTQEESYKFKSSQAKVQLKILTTDGKVLASDIFTIPVEELLNKDVMS